MGRFSEHIPVISRTLLIQVTHVGGTRISEKPLRVDPPFRSVRKPFYKKLVSVVLAQKNPNTFSEEPPGRNCCVWQWREKKPEALWCRTRACRSGLQQQLDPKGSEKLGGDVLTFLWGLLVFYASRNVFLKILSICVFYQASNVFVTESAETWKRFFLWFGEGNLIKNAEEHLSPPPLVTAGTHAKKKKGGNDLSECVFRTFWSHFSLQTGKAPAFQLWFSSDPKDRLMWEFPPGEFGSWTGSAAALLLDQKCWTCVPASNKPPRLNFSAAVCYKSGS